jgi:Flp pilus assembly protein TadD
MLSAPSRRWIVAQMCPKPARLATALAAILAMGCVASPAFALFGKAKPKADAAAAPAGSRPADPLVRKATAEQRAAAERLEPLNQATFWLRESQADPGDVEASVKLARALRAIGRFDEALQAADQAVVVGPSNVEALLENARVKIAANKAFYAVATLQRASQVAPKDWRPLSLLGVALEQSERPEEAREAYEQALVLSPDNPAVLSNMALFLAGRGDSVRAEALLRKAVARPGATAQERVNLALVLGLQGKMAEAEQMMRQDLPPEIANANLAYLRGVPEPGSAGLATARNWGALGGQQNGAAR